VTYRTLLDSIDEGYCIIEVLFDEDRTPVDYRFLEVNASFEAQTGLVNARGQRMRELAPQHEQHWFEIYGRIALTGRAERFEKPARQLNRWYDVYAFRVGLPESRRVAVLFRDITERKRLEAELADRARELQQAHEELSRSHEGTRAANRELQAIFDNAASGILQTDRNDRFVAVNDRVCEMLGYRRDELLGMTVHDLTHPDDRATSDDLNERLHKGVLPWLQYEKRYVRRDGTPLWALVAVSAVRDEAGNYLHSVGTVIDISAQKAAEAELRLHAAALEAAPSAVSLSKTDDQGSTVWVNKAFTTLTGYLPEEAIGRTHHMLSSGQQTADFYRRLWETVRRGDVWRGELVNRRKDGTLYSEEMGITPVRDETGNITHYVAVKQDVTERKRVEAELLAARESAERAKVAAEEASRAKDHFLAVLSHELRTPLTPVLSSLSMLEDCRASDHAIRDRLDMIRRNVELEARLIDDLLDVTRIARGRIELDRKPVRLVDVIRHAVEVVQPDIDARRLHFRFDGDDESFVVDADATRLQQVFWNLLRNAVKFTPRDGCVGVQCRRDGDGQVVVDVTDSGEGIDPEDLPHIFDAFAQAERSIKRQFGGLGLGLTISKALVDLHGGSIEVYSGGKGKGATFRLSLPLAMAEPRVEPLGAAAPQATPRALRILLVEDHGDTAEIMCLLLAAEGHTIEHVGDVATALEAAAAHEFDLLISDLGLPDASGLDLIRELRQRGWTGPGIVLSGYGQEQDIRRSREAGFAAHLVKPASPDKLAETIVRLTRPTADRP
jgi:two-component system CheB/CheR fusion protein